MLKRATMDKRSKVAKQAADDIQAWLRRQKVTVDVLNVEDLPEYRSVDIDLIWKTKRGDKTIEIKGDTYHRTGNFFLETFSNKERNTPGCFMYTEADFIFYYFIEIKKLYVLPMPGTRIWFLEHLEEFRESATQTVVGNGSYYTTVGRLVPIKTLLQNVENVKTYELFI
jgi:hypothetical protein